MTSHRDRILKLFGPEASFAERELDEKIGQSLQQFLRTTLTGSSATLEDVESDHQSTSIPESPSDMGDYFDMLAQRVVEHSDRVASPRFIGHMTSALPYFVRPLSRVLTTLNQNLVKVETSKALTPYEREALGMMHRLFYNYDDAFYAEHLQNKASTLGIMTSGGTLANSTALWIARNSALGAENGHPSVEAVGMADALRSRGVRRAVIIGSSLMHYSLEKGTDLLGLGAEGFVRVPTDDKNRVIVSAVAAEIKRRRAEGDQILALVGIAGTTDSGTVDPLEELGSLAKEAGVHFHVDAAWGGPVIFSRKHKDMLRGIELADSITVDGHKQLFLPMGIGLCILKDPAKARAIEKQAQYIIRADSSDLGKRALEGSRAGMVLYLHAALHMIGRDGYEFLMDEGIRKAKYLADRVRELPEFELLVDPQINIVNYRYLPASVREKVAAGDALSPEEHEITNAVNRKIQDVQRRSGQTFVSRTTLRVARYSLPVVAFRSVIANPLTTEKDIDAVLADGARIGAALAPPAVSNSPGH